MASSTPSGRDASGPGQRFEVDVTRQDIRSGMLLLPGSMLQVFEAGAVMLHDPARECDYTLTFTPPRSLSGFGDFFEAHSLQPNDKVIFVLDPERGELHVRKRPPRKRPKLEEPPILETDPPVAEAPADAAPPQPEASESGWVVREVRRGSSTGPPPSRQEAPAGRSALDDAERVSGASAPPQRAVPPPHEADENAGGPRAEHPQPPRIPPPNSAEALELVKAHLAAPDTPAIVRLEDVARAVRLPEEAAWHALERLANDPDSGVSLIRRDFYRISRQAQPKSG